MRLKMKNRSQRYDINRPRLKYGHKYTKYKMYLIIMIVQVLSNTYEIFESQFMKKLSDTEARGGSRASATSKMERFVIIVNGVYLDSSLQASFIADTNQFILKIHYAKKSMEVWNDFS